MSSRVVVITIPLSAGGERLDRTLVDLALELPLEESSDSLLWALSRSQLQKLIARGAVLCNGESWKPSTRLKGGERVTIEVPEPDLPSLIPQSMDLDILYEDEELVVVNKAAGVVVHPAAGHPDGTLVNGLLAHCHDLAGIGGVLRPGIVHRLDRYTSGVMVVAKTDRAHVHLARQFAERSLKKRYVAFVLGLPAIAEATFDTGYGRHPTDRKRFSSRRQPDSAKRAVTSYRILEHRGGISYLGVTISTGRTHQIRVHLSDAGHPIVGDTVYGGLRLGRIGPRALREAAAKLDRHALHAAELAFEHPGSGDWMTMQAALPPELEALERLVQG